MNIMIIDDDINVCIILRKIIEHKELGDITGVYTNPVEGKEAVVKTNPDIVLIDLLMPNLDGNTLVSDCVKRGCKSSFIMISQVISKDMITRAYESGIEFYINKPINAIEVERIIMKVTEMINLSRKLLKIEEAFGVKSNILQENLKLESVNYRSDYKTVINNIMQKIGIVGETASNDIRNIAVYVVENNININEYTLKDLLVIFNTNYKYLEQRLRRTITIGMKNLANLGIEDYMNETFCEYSTSLFKFEELKKEMDFIRKKRHTGGKVNVKKFIEGMVIYCYK